MSGQLLSIFGDGAFTTSLGYWLWCVTTFIVDMFFNRCSWNFSCYNWCPLPLTLLGKRLYAAMGRVWLYLFHNSLLGCGRQQSGVPEATSPPGWTSPGPSAIPHRSSAPAPTSLEAFCWTCSHLLMFLVLYSPQMNQVGQLQPRAAKWRWRVIPSICWLHPCSYLTRLAAFTSRAHC